MTDDTSFIAAGLLTAGPFRPGDLRGIEVALHDIGAVVAPPGHRPGWTRVAAGWQLEVSGEDVKAYFVDSDGIEISSSDLDSLVLAVVAEGVEFRIQGHHPVSDDEILVLNMVAIHDGQGVQWSGGRSVVVRNGKPKVLDQEGGRLGEILRARGPR